MIIIVDFISSRWRAKILEDQPPAETKIPVWKKARTVAYILLGIAAFMYCWTVTQIDLKDLFNHPPLLPLVVAFISIYLSGCVQDVVKEDHHVMQAVMATLWRLLAIPSVSGSQEPTERASFSSRVCYITRGAFNSLRSFEALLYVAIFVFWVGIGTFAACGPGDHTFALLETVLEAIEIIEPGPIEAARDGRE